ncbi:MAG: hypothetical protein EHM41_13770 [Chloroflexi bacterium]|nr:MAG: hypothetical protein EHM41_13770 [Chloroflexota bacterium]
MPDMFKSRVEALELLKLAGNDIWWQFHLVKNKGTDKYYKRLRELDVEDGRIFTTLASAYGALTASQGDKLYVYPGDHVQTAQLTWAKDDTSLIGVGSRNQRHQPSTLTTGAIRISTITANVSYVITVTGKYVTFENFGTYNSINDTDNLGDLQISARNFHGKNLALRGGTNATQVQSATSGIPLTIDTDAYGFRFDDCEIGSAGNTTRTTGPGFARFAAAAGGAGLFNRCAFSMRSETTGANPSGFTVEENALDRLLTYRDCTMYNFSENWGALPDYCFNIDQTTTFDILLINTAVVGFDIVSDNAHVKTIDAAPNSAGCEAVAVATS